MNMLRELCYSAIASALLACRIVIIQAEEPAPIATLVERLEQMPRSVFPDDHWSVTGLFPGPVGRILIYRSESGPVHRRVGAWNIDTGHNYLYRAWPEDQAVFGAAALSPDGRLLALHDDAGQIHFLDTTLGTTVRTISTGGQYGPPLAFDSVGSQLAVIVYPVEGSQEVRLDVYSTKTFARTTSTKLGSPPSYWNAITFAAGDKKICALRKNGAGVVLDLTTGKLNELEGPNSKDRHVWSSSVFQKADWIAAAGAKSEEMESGFVTVYQMSSGKRVFAIDDLGFRAFSTAFSADGTAFGIAGYKTGVGGFVRIWDTSNWSKRVSIDKADEWIWSIALSPDGRLAALGCWDDGKIRLLDARNGTEVRSWRADKESVTSTVFLGNGDRIASGGTSGIKFWSVKDLVGDK